MITKIAQVDFRDDVRVFGIKQEDRFQHLYVIGKTGTGKSNLLSFMALEDFKNGNGFCVIDPHGDMANELHNRLGSTPHIYFDLSDSNCPYGYNPFKQISKDRISLVASGFLETMKASWPDAWGVRMEHVLRNTLYALLETKGSKVNDILKMFSDKEYREKIVRNLENITIKNFWQKEYTNYSPSYRQDALGAIQNKIGAFLSDPLLRSVLSEEKKDISLRRIMDKGEILIVNLAKGKIGNDSAHLLGGFLVSTIGMAAFSRADTPLSNRRPFFLYVDEFQNFTTLSVVNMLSELRKYKVGMIFAHQFVWQLALQIRHSIFGNVGSIISFRVGAEDSQLLSSELFRDFTENDLMHLPNYHMYVKLLIDGQPCNPFSAKSLPLAESSNFILASKENGEELDEVVT
jgi:type IV secretory pathway TraG/TraD family ATPase VirD4